jgi:hypothetical protein
MIINKTIYNECQGALKHENRRKQWRGGREKKKWKIKVLNFLKYI